MSDRTQTETDPLDTMLVLGLTLDQIQRLKIAFEDASGNPVAAFWQAAFDDGVRTASTANPAPQLAALIRDMEAALEDPRRSFTEQHGIRRCIEIAQRHINPDPRSTS